MVEGRGTKAVLSILIIVVFASVICYFIYEKKSRADLKYNPTSNYLIPNLLKSEYNVQNNQFNCNLISSLNDQKFIRQEEKSNQLSKNVIQEESDDSILESFSLNKSENKNSNHIFTKRDIFLLNQNGHYSNCDDDCVNTNLVQNYERIF